MTNLFLRVLNISIAASWLVLAVFLVRMIFRKSPKWVHVLLWGIVAVRLVCPFSFESPLSLIPSVETVSYDQEAEHVIIVDSGIPVLDEMVASSMNEGYEAVDRMEHVELDTNTPPSKLSLIPSLWVLGMDGMLLYLVISYLRLRRKVSTAVILRDYIYQCEYVESPFVFGILRPRVYLPYGLTNQEQKYVVAHERAHIRRGDHWWKPLGYFLLILHWFNPLMWIAYLMLCRDIELACDEKVIRDLDNGQRADYTQALVSCSVSHRGIAACPLAFGEVGVKDRVRSVMRYQEPSFWIIALSVIACLWVSVCFLTDPKREILQPEILKEVVGHFTPNDPIIALVDPVIDVLPKIVSVKQREEIKFIKDSILRNFSNRNYYMEKRVAAQNLQEGELDLSLLLEPYGEYYIEIYEVIQPFDVVRNFKITDRLETGNLIVEYGAVQHRESGYSDGYLSMIKRNSFGYSYFLPADIPDEYFADDSDFLRLVSDDSVFIEKGICYPEENFAEKGEIVDLVLKEVAANDLNKLLNREDSVNMYVKDFSCHESYLLVDVYVYMDEKAYLFSYSAWNEDGELYIREFQRGDSKPVYDEAYQKKYIVTEENMREEAYASYLVRWDGDHIRYSPQ